MVCYNQFQLKLPEDISLKKIKSSMRRVHAVKFSYDDLFFNEISGPEKGRFGEVGQMVGR